jgi:hypothetical protein
VLHVAVDSKFGRLHYLRSTYQDRAAAPQSLGVLPWWLFKLAISGRRNFMSNKYRSNKLRVVRYMCWWKHILTEKIVDDTGRWKLMSTRMVDENLCWCNWSTKTSVNDESMKTSVDKYMSLQKHVLTNTWVYKNMCWWILVDENTCQWIHMLTKTWVDKHINLQKPVSTKHVSMKTQVDEYWSMITHVNVNMC